MPTSDVQLMELLAELTRSGQVNESSGFRVSEVSTYLGQPKAILSAPPASLTEILSGAPNFSLAYASTLERENNTELASTIRTIQAFLDAPETDLFSDRQTHFRLLDFVYTVV